RQVDYLRKPVPRVNARTRGKGRHMATRVQGRQRASHKIHRGQALAGWLFVLPSLALLLIFLVLPILMALWVSVSDWTGNGSPFSSDVHFVGADNYATLLTGGGLAEQDFATSLRNNAYYVFLVVPVQTVLSLVLAVLVNQRVRA